MNSLFKDKIKATSVHLVISLALVALCFAIIFFIWYPSPLIKATGVGALFIMMLAIDLILGPALTFLVYKKYKKTLKFDLLVIAAIQLSALGYGLYSMYDGRPVWIAFAVDRFELVRANDIIWSEHGNKLKTPQFGPEYIFVDIKTKTPKQQLDMMLKDAKYGVSPVQRSEFYRPLKFAKPEIINKALPLLDLEEFNSAKQVKALVDHYPTANGWLPLKANNVDMVILINKSNAEVVNIVDLRPWS